MNESDRTFWGWLIKHTWLFYSQIAVVLGALGFAASFIYYVAHGEYIEYLEPRTIQKVIFWLHLIVLILFIFWFRWIRDDESNNEKARKTVKGVFKRELTKEESKHSEEQLKTFKLWFFYFWVSMLMLYVAFFVQRYSPNYESVGKEEIFRMFNEYNSKNKDPKVKENEKANTQNLEEKVRKIENAIEYSPNFETNPTEFVPDIEINEKEHAIFQKIQDLRKKHLQGRIGEIKNELSNLKINKDVKYKEIYDQISAAYETPDNTRRKTIITETKEKIASLLDDNDLKGQEKEIFTKIKSLDTEELEKSVNEIANLISDLETSNTISKNNKIDENIKIAAESQDQQETLRAIKVAYKLSTENNKYWKSVNKLVFACITNIFNNLGWWLIFVCFILTTTTNEESKKREKKLITLSFYGFVFLSIVFPSVIFVVFRKGTTESSLTSWIVFFDGFSGILNAVALALLIARLDSKLIGLPSYLISILYFYAAFQPLFVVFEQPGEISQLIKTVVLVAVFISKIYFFLIITYAIQTGRILTYLYCYPILSKEVDKIFSNPFQIECMETQNDFKFKITKHNQDIYLGEYKEIQQVELGIEKIYEIKKYIKRKKYISKSLTTDGKYEIKIYGKDKHIICESINGSMSEDEANKLIRESKDYIPDCEVKIINKDKQVEILAKEDLEKYNKSMKANDENIEDITPE